MNQEYLNIFSTINRIKSNQFKHLKYATVFIYEDYKNNRLS